MDTFLAANKRASIFSWCVRKKQVQANTQEQKAAWGKTVAINAKMNYRNINKLTAEHRRPLL